MPTKTSRAPRQPIGDLVRACRVARGQSLGELSRRTKINAAALSRIENGVHEPKYGTLVAIAEELDASVVIGPDQTTLVEA